MTLILGPTLYSMPPKSPDSGARWDFRQIELTAAQVVNDNIVALGVIPAGCRVMDAFIEADDLDTGNAITMNVGLLNSNYNDPEASSTNPGTDDGTSPALVSGKNIFTSTTVGQAGARFSAPVLAFTDAIGVDHDDDRIIAVEFKTISSAQAGTLGLGLLLDVVD